MVCDENLDGNSSFLLIRATHSEQIEQINCKAWKYQDADPYHSLTETTLPPCEVTSCLFSKLVDNWMEAHFLQCAILRVMRFSFLCLTTLQLMLYLINDLPSNGCITVPAATTM